MNLSDIQIKNGWSIVKLGDVAGLQNGYAFKSNDFVNEGVPVIKIKSMASGKITIDSNAKYSKSLDNLDKYKLSRGAILISMTGSHLSQINSAVGKITYYKENFLSLLNQRVGKIYSKSNTCDNTFLYYVLSGNLVQEFWAKKATGSANQANISPEAIKSYEFILPPLSVQKYIAEIVSKYDDLIENNEKRIKILGSMAQKLYTEWFINFKFPEHEKVKMVDSGNSDFGMIPDGWGVLKILDIGKVITGKTPSTSNQEFYGGGTLFIKTPDIHGNIFITDSIQTLSDKGVENQKSKTLPPKTVFVSCIGTIGSVGITSRGSQTNQQINAVILKNNNDYIYLYFFISSLKKELINLGSNGATMGNVNKDKFENINLLYPERKILDSFFESSKDIFDEILNLQQQKQNLRKSRDLLIPQLIGGKINL